MGTYARTTLLPLALAASALACGRSEAQNSIRQAFAGRGTTPRIEDAVVFRFPANRGPGVRLYRLPRIDEVDWRFDARDLAVEDLIGFAPDNDQIYVRSPNGEFIALDLVSGRTSTIDTAVAASALGPTGLPHVVRADGSVGAIVERRAEMWEPTLTTTPSAVWGTTRTRLLALLETDTERTLALITRDEIRTRTPLPDGLLAATVWGDAMAVAVDSGVVVIETASGQPAGFRQIDAPVTALAFSRSGHRLFVGTAAPSLLVLARYGLDVLETHGLPATLDGFRVGPRGHHVLAHPAGRDSLWIADALDLSTFTAVAGAWDDDLPAVAPDGTVLLRQGDDVVALDAAGHTEVARIAGGAADKWLIVEWDLRRPSLQLAETPDNTARPGDQQAYVQLASTSNPSWAQARVDELRAAQMDARLLPPTDRYDRYRVVLGPYGTREEADGIGRRLGQPYFIIFFSDSTRTTP